jgi:ABC-type cobalamin/Fe3+-siderophores transport system ATPase subunit
MNARLAVDKVSWRAGATPILSEVTFEARAGDFVALMGRNGAGKSTVLDIVAGLRAASAGEVRLDGRAIGAWTAGARARLVAHLPQVVRSDLPFLAGDLVLMGRYPHTDRWFESDADREAVEEAMRRTGCWDLRARAVPTLSGGERQRVLLAACFAQQPRLWLLDEPSTYLDIDQQIHCFTALREECERGSTCLAVMHDVNLALTYATRLVVLDGGAVVVDLPVTEAARSPAWLVHFSSRLELMTTPNGRPWVSYS